MILDSEETSFVVVINHEQQYSIWPQDLGIPAGWRLDGLSGTKAECLAYVEEAWTDMRPLSLREFMERNPVK